MSKRKRKLPSRLVVIWDAKETTRLTAAVERFHSLVNDLETLLAEPKRRAEAAAATRRARQAMQEAIPNGTAVSDPPSEN